MHKELEENPISKLMLPNFPTDKIDVDQPGPSESKLNFATQQQKILTESPCKRKTVYTARVPSSEPNLKRSEKSNIAIMRNGLSVDWTE